MSKNQSTALKGLSSLGMAVVDANIKLANAAPKVGRIGVSKLLDTDTVRAIREAVQNLVGELRGHYQALGAVLADPESMEWQADDVRAEEEQLTAATTGTGNIETKDRPYQVVALAAAEAMLEFFPRSPIGVSHFADHGIQIGFLRPLGSDEKKFFVELPVGGPSPVWRKLVSDIAGSTPILTKLLGIVAEVSKAVAREKKDKASTLRAASASFLSVMAAGEGRTVCFVPGGNKDGKPFPPVYLQIELRDAWVTVLDAVGSRFSTSLIGVSIPVNSVGHKKFHGDAIRGMGADRIKSMVGLRRFIEDGLAHARAEQARQKPDRSVAASCPEVSAAAPAPVVSVDVAPASIPDPSTPTIQ